MSILTTVEEYVRWHPDVTFADVYDGLDRSIEPDRINTALCRLYSMHILRCRRGDVIWNGQLIRCYLYTHILTYRGPREDVE